MLTKSKTKHCIVKKDAAILLTWKQKRKSDMKLPILCPTESLTKRRLSFHTLKPSESLTRMQKTACAPAPKPVSLWLLYKNIPVEQKKTMFAREPKLVSLATIMVPSFLPPPCTDPLLEASRSCFLDAPSLLDPPSYLGRTPHQTPPPSGSLSFLHGWPRLHQDGTATAC